MLKTPQLNRFNDPILEIIARVNSNTDQVKELEPGAFIIPHWSGDMLIWGRNAPEFYMSYPELGRDLDCLGVCDTPEQFLKKFRQRLADDKQRTFCVTFTRVAKNPENARKGGGWRWHKWGPYIGEGKPTCEYLDDEDGFEDGVYCFHIYQIAGPEVK